MNFNIFSLFQRFVKREFNNLQRYLQKFMKIGSAIYRGINKFLKGALKTIMSNPSSYKDYVKFSDFYISKKILFISFMATILVGYVLIFIAYPWAEGVLWTSTVELNSQKFYKYSGNVRLVNKDKSIIYEGKMKSGKVNGTGTLYDNVGVRVYEGGFENNQYEGYGIQYIRGAKVYDGEFSSNLYEGKGTLYDAKQRIIYSGEFSKGLMSGEGIEYNPETGLRTYQGSFANGAREGMGVYYDKDGKTIIYEGNSVQGKYSGAGKLFKNSSLIYGGSFLNGEYHGIGTLYDEKSGAVRYTGDFQYGLFHGKGTLYNPNTAQIEYEGNFVSNKQNGTGKAYDSLGFISFDGEFQDGAVNYMAYLGKKQEQIVNNFGSKYQRKDTESGTVISYGSRGISFLFTYVGDELYCERIILNSKAKFLNINFLEGRSGVHKIMGQPFSYFEYPFSPLHKLGFSSIGMSIKGKLGAYSDKYIMETYFIRIYYSDDGKIVEGIEIASI